MLPFWMLLGAAVLVAILLFDVVEQLVEEAAQHGGVVVEGEVDLQGHEGRGGGVSECL